MDSELKISRLIRAPRARVWQAWADPRQFERWWIPAPMELQIVKMDLVPGGGFETLMREPGAALQPHLQGCFLAVVPEEKIVFTTVLAEGWKPIEPWLALTSIVTMVDEGPDTRYVARALHRTPEDCRKHDEMGFQEGWGTVLDQLARMVQG